MSRTPKVVIAGLGDTGVLVATRLARRFDVVAIGTRPALVSGQELGTRLTDPARWRRTYLVAFRRFRRLDRARILHGRVTAVDLDGRRVTAELATGEEAVEPYDVLVVATGASNGFWRHDRIQDQQAIDDELDDVIRTLTAATTIAVVGGGATAVSVADNLARKGPAAVHLLHPGDEPLAGYHPAVRRWVIERLRADGVAIHPGHRADLPETGPPNRLTAGPVTFSTGQDPFPADVVLWAIGGARPHSDFLPSCALDEAGFVRVDEHLRLPDHPEVLAVGDVAASDPNRSSARNWGWRVVVANATVAARGRGRLRRFRAPEHRWGSIFGVQDDGLVVVQPNGRRFRVPRWAAEPVLMGLFVTRYLYGGLRPEPGRPARP